MRKVTTYILKVTTPCHISAVHDRVFQVVYLIRPPGSTPRPGQPGKSRFVSIFPRSQIRGLITGFRLKRAVALRTDVTRKHARKSQGPSGMF